MPNKKFNFEKFLEKLEVNFTSVEIFTGKNYLTIKKPSTLRVLSSCRLLKANATVILRECIIFSFNHSPPVFVCSKFCN